MVVTVRLLIVEDETRMARLLQKGLEEEGYVAELAADGHSGLACARNFEFDVIVLDVMLPGMDGFHIVRKLRAEGLRTPVLMLTARDATPDIVTGLNLGADDYLTKPFSFQVLLARIRALSRRGPVARPVILSIDDLQLNPFTHEVHRGGRPIVLTRTEFSLFEVLLRRAGHVVHRTTLIESVWGSGRNVESNTLDVFIRLLRSKVEDKNGPRLIHTVRGIGYMVRKEEPR
jgi:DNA-binding response OmpR family regulator